MIPEDDRGLTLGDGLFETLLWTGAAFDALEAHAERLERGCAVLGLPTPEPAAFERIARTAVAGAGLHVTRAAVRVTLTAGSGARGLEREAQIAPRLFGRATASPRIETPARVILAQTRRNEGSPASRLKTLAYIDNVLARREARAVGADEALLMNNGGEIAGGAAANLFWVQGGRLLTPALHCGVLDGIIRGRVMAAAGRLGVEVIEVRQAPPEPGVIEAAFLTSSLIGLRAISAWEGAALAADHALVRRLAAGFA